MKYYLEMVEEDYPHFYSALDDIEQLLQSIDISLIDQYIFDIIREVRSGVLEFEISCCNSSKFTISLKLREKFYYTSNHIFEIINYVGKLHSTRTRYNTLFYTRDGTETELSKIIDDISHRFITCSIPFMAKIEVNYIEYISLLNVDQFSLTYYNSRFYFNTDNYILNLHGMLIKIPVNELIDNICAVGKSFIKSSDYRIRSNKTPTILDYITLYKFTENFRGVGKDSSTSEDIYHFDPRKLAFSHHKSLIHR